MIKALLVGAALMGTTSPPAGPIAEPPAPASVTEGPATAAIVDTYYSVAATQLVVIIEISSMETIDSYGGSAVYIGPDGQQVEASGRMEPDQVYPGATALVTLGFPAAAPGGRVIYPVATSEDYASYDIELQVPAS